MSTLRPASNPALGGGCSKLSASSIGSHIRPAPISPQAWPPEAGPRMRTPRDTTVSTFACVALLAHMIRFMAGARTTGASVARHRVVNKSSARPPARRARKSALAGAISTSWAQRASSMCPIAASAALSQRSLRVGRPDTAWKLIGVMNFCAAAVMTTWTSAPRSIRRRTRSGLL